MEETANEKPGHAGPIRVWAGAWPLFRRIARPVLIYEAGWKLAVLFLLGPLTTAILNAAIALGRGSAVTNNEIVGFVLSPTGVVTLSGFGILTLAVLFFEQAGLVVLALTAIRGERASLRRVIGIATRDLPRLARIAAMEVVIALVCVAPFLALMGLTYVLLLGGTDINFFLATRPPRFLVAVAIGGVLATGAAAVLALLYVRWIFAVPAGLFERHSSRSSLLTSAEMVRGRAWRVLGSVVVWQGAKLVGFALLALVLDFISGAVLAAIGTNRTVVLGAVAFLMVIIGGAFALASMVDMIGFGLLMALLYEEGRREVGEPPVPMAPALPATATTWRRRLVVTLGVVGLLALITAGEALLVVRKFANRHPVAVTAHRAGPRPAPENSLSALRAGIASGAAFAEIDVQKTKDGVIVVIHDEDLRRLAGVARPVREMTFAEIRALDIGAQVGPEFAGEKIASLDEFIATAKGHIKLNIELKYYGHDPTLATDVVAMLRDRGFTSEVVITSLDPRGLAEVRKLDRQIPIGYIVSARIGDITRLDVDFLSLRHSLITPALVRAAGRRHLKLHAWTINDPGLAVRMIDRGVDNLITDEPTMALRVVAWRAGLSDVELVLLRFRDWLGTSTFPQVVREEESTLGTP
jgi:glycerophosphoryl diester phosphodiesterase